MAKLPAPGFKQDDDGAWYLPWDFPAWQDFIGNSDEDDDDDDSSSAPVIALSNGISESDEVIAAQTAALEYTKANEEKIKNEILETLLPFYQKWREVEQKEMGEFSDFGPDGEYPELNSIEGLERVFSFEGIYLTEEIDDGIVRVGYAFNSPIEDEHGIGVVTCRGNVLGVGYQDACYDGVLEGCFSSEEFYDNWREFYSQDDDDDDDDADDDDDNDDDTDDDADDDAEGMSDEEVDKINKRMEKILDGFTEDNVEYMLKHMGEMLVNPGDDEDEEGDENDEDSDKEDE